MLNANLNKAKQVKNDEFYTRYADIQAEVAHYEKHFAGKVVYCNCDDPAKSNFVKYFMNNKARLGLRGLLINHLRADGTGDFRSRQATAKLAQADIVCTNPPFSLFRQFIAQLMGATPAPLLDSISKPADKKFLIVGNMNSITCKEIFPLMQNKRMQGGVGRVRDFILPCGGSQKLGNVGWFTNLDHGAARPLTLTRKYNPAIHLPYDNYPAVNVDKIADIPCDYDGAVGVPVTFLMDYDTSGFDIIKLRYGEDGKDLVVNGKEPYNRIIIKRKEARND